jgi:N-acetylglucosaminyl-diphospho-decaprenol L-rhamnosyltransferase
MRAETLMHDLDIVIVNWNAGSQLRDCLASVASAAHSNVNLGRVVLVDNNSTDNSLDGIDAFQLPVQLIKNAENRGFGAACNQGAIGSTSEYLLFLNPDAVLYEDSLTGAIEFMASPKHSLVGILGIKLFDEHGGASRTCARFPTAKMFLLKSLGLNSILPRMFPSYIMEEWDHETSREVDHVIGAFYFVRRSLFETLGGFDEQFFVYLEDLDFSLRTHLAGWKIYYLASVSAFHKGGGVSDQIKAIRLFYSLRSRIVYVHKHFKQPQALLVVAGTLVAEPILRLVKAMFSFSISQMIETLGGYWMLWSMLARRFRG